jgi:hypothetical protein
MLQNSLGFWYSRLPRNLVGSGLKVQSCLDSSICPELTPPSTFNDHNFWTVGRMTPPSTFNDHNFWTVGRMRAYLYFLERSQNSLSLLHWVFLLILHHIELAEFCKIIVSPSQKLYSRFFHLCAVPMIITSSLFIGFEHTSNSWKVEKVKYEFCITSFLIW